jgi:hypothetical protein
MPIPTGQKHVDIKVGGEKNKVYKASLIHGRLTPEEIRMAILTKYKDVEDKGQIRKADLENYSKDTAPDPVPDASPQVQPPSVVPASQSPAPALESPAPVISPSGDLSEDEMILCLHEVYKKYQMKYFYTDEMDAAMMEGNEKCDIENVAGGITVRSWITESLKGPSGSMEISQKGLEAMRIAGLITEEDLPSTTKPEAELPAIKASLVLGVLDSFAGTSIQPIEGPVSKVNVESSKEAAAWLQNGDLIGALRTLSDAAQKHDKALSEKTQLTGRLGSLRGELVETQKKLDHVTNEEKRLTAELQRLVEKKQELLSSQERTEASVLDATGKLTMVEEKLNMPALRDAKKLLDEVRAVLPK